MEVEYKKVTKGHYEIIENDVVIGEVWDEYPRKSSYSDKWQGGYINADGEQVRIRAYSLMKFKKMFANRDCPKCHGRGFYDDYNNDSDIPWSLCEHKPMKKITDHPDYDPADFEGKCCNGSGLVEIDGEVVGCPKCNAILKKYGGYEPTVWPLTIDDEIPF